MSDVFNTASSPPEQLALCVVGWLAWMVVSADTLRLSMRTRLIQVPAVAVTGKLAWDVLWGFVYSSDLGAGATWATRLSLAFDLWLLQRLFTHVVSLQQVDWVRRWYPAALVGGTASWLVTLYFSTRQGHDTATGAVSAAIVNVVMSSMFIAHLLRRMSTDGFSALTAWTKLVGTTAVAAYCLLAFPQNLFLQVACLTSLGFDGAYIAAFYRVRKGPVPTFAD